MVRFSPHLGEKSHPVLQPAPGASLAAVAASIHGLQLLLPVPDHAGYYGRLSPSSCFCLWLLVACSRCEEPPFLPLLWCGCQVAPIGTRHSGARPLGCFNVDCQRDAEA